MAKKSKSDLLRDITINGQVGTSTTRREAIVNLALRGIRADFGPEQADTFRRDLLNPFLTPTYF
ncbi:MAG: hypothetical protein K9M08_13195 [Pirellula sp.]|nr:hypothetical protein [Pirellula sp.]